MTNTNVRASNLANVDNYVSKININLIGLFSFNFVYVGKINLIQAGANNTRGNSYFLKNTRDKKRKNLKAENKLCHS